jgi:hypothetical protein
LLAAFLVRVGKTRRITLPAFMGVIPRSEATRAFSMALSCPASHGWMARVRASGTAIDAI